MPSRKIFLPTATSSNSRGIRPSLLSKIKVTAAFPTRGTFSEPFQMSSSPFLLRRDFMDCSPITQRTPSTILDFPEPLGPTIAAIFEGNSKTVARGNDLNPESSSFFRYIETPLRDSLLDYTVKNKKSHRNKIREPVRCPD